METVILTPEKINAFRLPNGDVALDASGREDGICNIRWEKSAAIPFPPIYMVVGEQCGAIGNFPFQTRKVISYPTNIDYVNVQTGEGSVKVQIVPVPADTEGLAEAQAVEKTGPDEVVGYSYNQVNVDGAISNAISKLRKTHNGAINAVVKETGFVAVGSPIGIAYLYVVMEQKS